MKFLKFILLFSLLFLQSCGSNDKDKKSIIEPEPEQQTQMTIVEKYGQLQVQGNKILDQNGNPVTLRGMSLFWSQWMGKFYNKECIQWLRDDWTCTVVRAAMGIEAGGYLTNPQQEKEKIFNAIDACIELGIYVIVDWHDHHAHNHLQDAKNFFREVAIKYGNHPNIIYEIYNEPEKISWDIEIKPYAEQLVQTIRQFDSDNLIVVGTSWWSQNVDEAAADPIDAENIAYTLHFYSASHKGWLRDKAQGALNKNIALFVTEFGTCEASADGPIDYVEVNAWLAFMDRNNLSWANWSIADKEETAAVLKPGSSVTGNWAPNDLTESGQFIRNEIIKRNQSIFDELK